MKRFALFALAALAACSGGDAVAPPPVLNATWTGTTNGQTFSMILTENGGSVTGSGTLTNTPSGTLALTVTGSYASPNVSLSMTSGLHPAINLTAVVAGKTMTGTLQGSGFTGDAITLTKP